MQQILIKTTQKNQNRSAVFGQPGRLLSESFLWQPFNCKSYIWWQQNLAVYLKGPLGEVLLANL